MPCDAPDIASDLAARLRAGLSCVASSRAAYARAGGRSHPTFCLLDMALKDQLKRFLLAGGRQLGAFLSAVDAVAVDFADQGEHFANLNSEQDVQGYLRRHQVHEP